MSLSKKQTFRYWREWQAVCKEQKWTSSDDDARYKLHAVASCPKSMRDFSNTDFDRFLSTCEGLKNRVDIRERDRERVDVSVERLNAAIREITGKDYATGILRDMHDQDDTYGIPLDPRDEQRKRGRIPNRRGEKGTMQGDLANLRDTLKNRLSKLLTAIKRGRSGDPECPAGREWWLPCANNEVIRAIMSDKVCIRIDLPGGRVEYKHLTREEHAATLHSHSTPDAVRGLSGDIFIDEYAFADSDYPF